MDLRDNEKDVKIFNKEDFADGEVPENTQRKRWKNTNVISSMEFAITGIWTAFKEERNMRKHTLSGVLALILGVVLQIQEFEWLFLFLAIFL
ncbi:MAG: diacylglycerol kinase family protein, partial [Lactococcus sp.]